MCVHFTFVTSQSQPPDNLLLHILEIFDHSLNKDGCFSHAFVATPLGKSLGFPSEKELDRWSRTVDCKQDFVQEEIPVPLFHPLQHPLQCLVKPYLCGCFIYLIEP